MKFESNPSNERSLRLLSLGRPVQFEYLQEDQTFKFGEEVQSIDDIPHWGVTHSQGGDNELSKDETMYLIETVPVVHTFRSPIALPKFSNFISENWDSQLEAETLQVMVDAMDTEAEWSARSGYRLGYDATLISREQGRLVLKTLGNCSCLGPDATTGEFGSEHWDKGVSEYTYHNIDKREQRVSLLAGLGHLARLASQHAK